MNIYVTENAMEPLLSSEEIFKDSAMRDITVEFVDVAPLTAEVVFDGEDAEISVYARDEMHTNTNKIHHGMVKDGMAAADEGDADTVEVAFIIAKAANCFICEKGMADECVRLDGNTEGVLFDTDKDGELTAKIVKGMDRPSLLCTTLFGVPQMTRPYADEILRQMVFNEMSVEELEKSAEQGDAEAMEQLLMKYLNGDGKVGADPEKAYYWCIRYAQTGNASAMFNAGLFCAKGFGVDRDFGKAAEWMRKAYEAGDGDAKKCAENYEKMSENEVNAAAGDAQAQADLARALMELGGSLDQAGSQKDYELAVMWAGKAVEQGNANAYWILALAYCHGRGVKADELKAIELYRKGAELGDAACQHSLGCYYINGEYLKKDSKIAFELFQKSANQGYGLAMRDLGRCYQFGDGCMGNMKTALEWYTKASEILDDPELKERVTVFQGLADIDPNWGEDYPGDEDIDE